MSEDKSARIRELNDKFRTTGQGGQTLFTQGVLRLMLAPGVSTQILVAVRGYDDFSSDNDPYGEHDFGAFEIASQKLFWKIDYYAPDMKHGSTDAANPDLTTRVLTIMLANEY